MTASRRRATLPLQLIALAVIATVAIVLWFANAQTPAHAQTPPNQSPTGVPRVLVSAEDAGVLAADVSRVGDPDGIPNVGSQESTGILHEFSYRWVRVDSGTGVETVVGADSARYRRVAADVGELVKVEVSFTDSLGTVETVTSLPFGPLAGVPRLPSSTLVANTAQTHSADATITEQYAMGFRLGDHGQGYEISGVSIELAAAPSSLTVSLWAGPPPGHGHGATARTKLFDFEDPPSFAVGLNDFAAPPGAFAYQNLDYFVVLSGFGSSLSIKETTSDAEDTGGETGATLRDKGTRTGVLRLAVKGSQRKSGILVSTYAQIGGNQEIVSVGDQNGVEFTVGTADRYLIRGVTFSLDDTTSRNGGFTNPWELRDGGTELFRMVSTRQIFGINEFTAPQGATVTGTDSYELLQDVDSVDRMGGVTLGRHACTPSTSVDSPSASGVTLDGNSGNGFTCDPPLMAVFGEPLAAMVQNLGQTHNSYASAGGSSSQVLSQGFTTGPDSDGYELLGIGVDIDGSGSQFPDGPTSVSVAVHADSGGKPGAKLFDLLSPSELAAGHSFFEAPPGTALDPGTSYVLVWSYNGGTWHRLQRTSGDSADSGALTGFSIANAFYRGAGLDSLSVDSNGFALEIAVYGRHTQNAIGVPRVLVSAEDAGVLAADVSRVGDPDGIPNVGSQESTGILHEFSYRWVRVDSGTGVETVVGADSARYRRVAADVGELVKVEVSFTDSLGTVETVTSLPFGPLAGVPRLPSSTLVANTAQTHSADATITEQYAMGFRLGDHGQGYEISGVSIELAAAPSSLTVSLWAGTAPGRPGVGADTKLFDFENPASLAVGLNDFTAPAGTFAYQNHNYHIVLSDFGSSLSIKETTSDAEDTGGETGATLQDKGTRTGVLRLAVKGSQRKSGILVSTYAQIGGNQEIVSVGDQNGVEFTVGTADRYLIRGVTFSLDDTTTHNGGFTNPWELRDGGTELFRMVSTRQIFGINEFTAPQGATVTGTDSYELLQDVDSVDRMGGVTLGRHACTPSTSVDSPSASGVTLDGNSGNGFTCDPPLMAIFGEPLTAMVQNLGQTHNSYASAGGTNKVLSQGFTTGCCETDDSESDAALYGYRLLGIGVDIDGSGSQFPDGPVSVSVAVHADLGGKPGAKLFDLLSPSEYAAGHSFFEAPPGTHLAPDTPYVLVWRHLRGTVHRLAKTSSNSEDSGAVSGASVADAFYQGAGLANMAVDSGGNSLELAVYTVVNDKAPFVARGVPVTTSWLHIPDGAEVGDQFRLVFVTQRATLPTSGDIEDYNKFVQEEAAGTLVRGKPVRGKPAAEPYTDPVIHRVASQFTAVVCTAAVDAVTNTKIAEAGSIAVPVHWLDGGWQDRPTLIVEQYSDFYGDEWVNTEYGAYVTGNSAHFHENAMVWTGCDASGVADPKFPMGSNNMGLVAAGSPRDPADNTAPVGAVDVTVGRITGNDDEHRPIYAISPIFTVVP
ncbi:choice-of-anchor R domain-containing protein [Candidatus Poriferisodalis sp.]|uniref:choice-of-anchor R domain-containing protein n=1 Tax=Candidatus Poriferisodalis sp. TaxID=3101277 RepID=UPI003B518197